MMKSDQVEELVCQIASFDRAELVSRLMGFTASFPVDFTPDYLNDQSTERLGHLLFALCFQTRRLPMAA